MEKNLHINQTGENWEVESEAQTLVQTETKAEAIEAAMEVALESDIEQIFIHTSDGAVETAISVEKPAGG